MAERTAVSWDREVNCFFAAREGFDAILAADQPLGFPAERLFQGPIANALTHIRQIALLRLSGSPVRGENYFKAEIEKDRGGGAGRGEGGV